MTNIAHKRHYDRYNGGRVTVYDPASTILFHRNSKISMWFSRWIFKIIILFLLFFLKLVLSVILAAAAAAPSHLHALSPYVDLHHPEYHVSSIVEHVPTAVSHQSRIDYHHKPIYHPIISPVAVHSVHHAPIVYSEPHLHHAPLLHTSPWAHSWK